MSMLKNWKVILCLVAIFAAGAVAGSLFTLGAIKRAVKHGRDVPAITDRVMNRLESKLDLSADQSAKIRPIIGQAAEKAVGARTEATLRNLQTVEEAVAQIKKQLTAEQLRKFEEMEKQRRKKLEAFLPAGRN